jgi:hypothetical protein
MQELFHQGTDGVPGNSNHTQLGKELLTVLEVLL